MDATQPRFEYALENLDRGVLLLALWGIVINSLEHSASGVLLTLKATIIYGLMRNRITNLDHFQLDTHYPPPPGVDMRRFTLICQWLGSRHLYDGLLGDLSDPETRATEKSAKQYLREMLWPAIGHRIWRVTLDRLWLNRFV